MNDLSKDDLLAVFRFLSGRDTVLFKRLNRRIGEVIASYPRDFSKPQIKLSIKNEEEFLGSATITTTKGEASLTILNNMGVNFAENGFDTGLLTPLLPRGKKRTAKLMKSLNGMRFDAFAEWLFSKADIYELNSECSGVLADVLLKAMVSSGCKCFEIHGGWTLNSNFETQEREWFTTFHVEQQKMGVRPTFWAHNYYSYENFESYKDRWEFLTSLFGEVSIYLCHTTPWRFSEAILGLISAWSDGIKNLPPGIRLRFHYPTNYPIEPHKYKIPLVEYLREWDQMRTCNVEVKELDVILRCPTLEKLPKHLDFAKLIGPKVLRFYLDVENGTLLLTYEVLPKWRPLCKVKRAHLKNCTCTL